MFDLKVINSVLSQLEEERGIPREKIIEAIEAALATAYKKEYGKKGQIVRATFDLSSGKTEFSQVKIVVDETRVIMPPENPEAEAVERAADDERIFFNPEHHILIDDAKKIKKDAMLDDEMVFPLESKSDFGRIAAQTAKQVIMQKIREAEKVSVMNEYGKREGEIVNGTVHRVEETPRGIFLKLSRSHPKFLEELFKIEAPEIANKTVEIKAVAREAGSRTKVAAISNDSHIDPVGSLVGQRGVRVSTVMSELGGEKIDIIEWSADQKKFVEGALSPAKIISVTLNEEEHKAEVVVAEDQQSLAIGKGGQNVRLAAKLTGWKIDIKSGGAENPPEKLEVNVSDN